MGAQRGVRAPLVATAGVLLAAGMVLSSCGTSAQPPSSSSSSTSGPTSTTTVLTAQPCGVLPGPDLVLDSADEPCTVTTSIGVTIHLALAGGFNWGDPKTDAAVVRVEKIQRPAGGGGLQADVVAVAPGQATVMSTGGVACPPGQPCPMLARLWALHVDVVDRTPPPRTVALNESDSARRVVLNSGDGLRLELAGPANYTWSAPASSDTGVLQVVSASSGATVTATFLAVAQGSATVTATDNPNCYPQCLATSRVFRITVVVTG
ncbi:MAG: hypothetical protein ACYDA2_03685 [Acidimicrobiales bacterium]